MGYSNKDLLAMALKEGEKEDKRSLTINDLCPHNFKNTFGKLTRSLKY